MRVLLLFLLCLPFASGCDTALSPYEDGIVEGTYTLPDGTTASFTSRATAQAYRYSGLGTSDTFQFGTAYESEDTGTLPTVRIAQDGLRPVPGTFSAALLGDGVNPPVSASIFIRDVPGFEVERGGTTSSAASVYLGIQGTVTLRTVGDRIEGTFDLYGTPDGAPESVSVRVEGRFDTPWLEAR